MAPVEVRAGRRPVQLCAEQGTMHGKAPLFGDREAAAAASCARRVPARRSPSGGEGSGVRRGGAEAARGGEIVHRNGAAKFEGDQTPSEGDAGGGVPVGPHLGHRIARVQCKECPGIAMATDGSARTDFNESARGNARVGGSATGCDRRDPGGGDPGGGDPEGVLGFDLSSRFDSAQGLILQL